MILTLYHLAGIVMALLAIIGWFTRLEIELKVLKASHSEHRQNLRDLEAAIWGKLDNMQKQMTSIITGLAKIEGKLESKHEQR